MGEGDFSVFCVPKERIRHSFRTIKIKEKFVEKEKGKRKVVKRMKKTGKISEKELLSVDCWRKGPKS